MLPHPRITKVQKKQCNAVIGIGWDCKSGWVSNHQPNLTTSFLVRKTRISNLNRAEARILRSPHRSGGGSASHRSLHSNAASIALNSALIFVPLENGDIQCCNSRSGLVLAWNNSGPYRMDLFGVFGVSQNFCSVQSALGRQIS
ncbi:hypothetical protein Ahy_A01g001120 isoform D [Arachis hypogaea]|uniref:Uncharacterized protein n=1 Tax=Arachis hypogaea TaxID=3818 RepID=A0A445EMB3_ARAHY|nr:hypothetical protein Ahy_A01g001120 isoform D [Arachis hypogaea]